jgi:DNA invertase Pin-like site-specific DNA recombinase
MRCSVYARFSSDLQRETSIDDQVMVARRFAEGQGWTILDEHVYSDAAISGASVERRAGLRALLAAAERQPRPFDVVLVDDSSRVSRDIADAIRIMQRLKFWGTRVIYLSQGIDSDSEQAESLVTVHGLVDSLYLKELAKKIKRGLEGQQDRGFATGGRTFGYRTVPVLDPSGKKDPNGGPVLLGKRTEVDPAAAASICQIFEWAADGLGPLAIAQRLNAGDWAKPAGGRWRKGAIQRVLQNERYRGLHIWGQRYWERQPGTGRKHERRRPRNQWRVAERPALRIVSEELWARVQTARAAIREALAPKRNLARGKDARFHSPHLFSGFAHCGCCGGRIGSVSGGKGSPRFGCARAWRDGPTGCTNRLTIRIKVAEPQLVARLRLQLLEPETVTYIASQLRDALSQEVRPTPDLRKQLAEEQRKRTNLIAAIERGANVLSVLATLKEREATIARLEREIEAVSAAVKKPLDDTELRVWVEHQLSDLYGLLKDNPQRAKAEFRRLNLSLVFDPIAQESDNPYFRVNGQCDLSALAFSFSARAERRTGADVDRSLVSPALARSWSRARFMT